MKRLPVQAPRAFDSSILATFQRCPRKAQYQYWYNRSPVGVNYPIAFGVSYHKFREVLEKLSMDGVEHQRAYTMALGVALEMYPPDPPVEHKKAYLTLARLEQTCYQGYEIWLAEKDAGRVEVIATEAPFELELPCGEMYGGRMDQIVRWNKKLWLRDFKTTGRMGSTYQDQFDPNAQFTGYVWATTLLSGSQCNGVMVETIYNTKLQGPEHHPFLSTRTPFHVKEWTEDMERVIANVRLCEATGFFPKHTTACGDYGGCFYRDACSMSSEGARAEWLLHKTTESIWDFAAPEKETQKIDR